MRASVAGVVFWSLSGRALSALRSFVMVPPRWPDEQGRPIPTYPCVRCGLEVASRFRGFRVENLEHVGWRLFQPTSYVNWCGHAQEIIPVPLADGRVTFVPVLGEAR